MDFFGIGSAVLGAARIYFQSARQSGRTTELLGSLKDGDRIIVLDEHSKNLWLRILSDRKLDVQVKISPINRTPELFEFGTAQGKTVFDHAWVERFYLDRIEGCGKTIDALQERLSGWGEAHEKTRLQAAQLQKWSVR